MTSDQRRPTRRAYLRAIGATAAVGALAGCTRSDFGLGGTTTTGTTTTGRKTTGTTTGATTSGETTGTTPESETTETTTGTPNGTTTGAASVDEDRFETVVNVADAGADASGEEPVDPVLADHVGDDTMLYFPPGRYRLREWELVGYRNLGVVGDDATFVPPDGHRRYWLRWADLRDFAFEGVTLDCRARRTAPTTHLSVSGGTNVVRDVTMRGHRRPPPTAFEVAATAEDAALRFENLSLPDGSATGHAVFVYPDSVGDLTFRDCRLEHWKEGLYAAYHSGPLRVVGGYYANNGIEQVRVGGGKTGALVRGVTVRVDDPKQARHKPNMRGIWAEEGAHVRIENCDVAITDLSGTYSSGAIVVGKQFGNVVVRNTRIETDADAYGILVRDPVESMAGQRIPSMGSLPEDWRVTCRNVRMTGAATDLAAVRAVRRDDCLLENVCVHHPKGSRNGVEVVEADGCAVRNSTIDVSGDPISGEDAVVVTSRVRTDGSC